MRVLIADDDDGLRFFLRKSLEETGRFECDVVPDGRFAVDRIQSDPAGFNAVILDVNMPRLDGFGFIERIRRSDRYRAIPILVLTTENDPQKRERARKAGATGWIVKPFEAAKLVDTVGRLSG